MVLKTVLPTSVLAPHTWYTRNERCSRAPNCGDMVYFDCDVVKFNVCMLEMKLQSNKRASNPQDPHGERVESA